MLTHEQLIAAIPDALDSVEVEGWGPKLPGKVRESYAQGDRRLLITTDRVSAFDRILGLIPYRGQVLNQLSLWWFEQTQNIVANHVIGSPDPNVTIARQADALPVEVIVRAYLTGVTSTSLWTLYAAGDRHPYGISLPDGMRKNDRLPQPIITPTTKAIGGLHDDRLTRDEILAQGLVESALWEQVEAAALALFARGTQIAAGAGLILVDTKYEFGLIDGRLAVIDEIHTPDSSRYWTQDSYHPGSDDEPENMDKEYLRRWFVAQGYRGEGTPPAITDDFAATVAGRYITVYEKLTGGEFQPGDLPADERIKYNLAQAHG
jgi:phosphoribosylaminoimidazole-succinocarboxamide synthase